MITEKEISEIWGNDWINGMNEGRLLLGKSFEEVQRIKKAKEKRKEEVFKKLKEEIQHLPGIIKAEQYGEPWYGGRVHIEGWLKPTLQAWIVFSDDHEWYFEGENWGPPCNIDAIGGGPWMVGFKHPEDGEEMTWECGYASGDFGIVQVSWWGRDKGLLGNFAGPAIGFGIGITGGNDRWHYNK